MSRDTFSSMQVDFAALADYAAPDASGKLTVVGIFDEIYAQQAPVIWPSMVLLLRFRIKRSELGESQKMVVKLMGEDGDILFQIDGEFTAQAQGEIQHRPEGTMNQILQIGGLKLPRFGAYSFEILLNNTAVASVPLYVRSRPAQA